MGDDGSPSASAGQQPHPLLQTLIAYWERIRPHPLLPGRQHFDPSAIPELLPHLWLIDVVAGSPRSYRYRLVGTAIIAAGSPVRSGIVLQGPSTATDLYDLVVEQRRFDWQHGGPPLFEHSQQVYALERAVLPFASNGNDVDLIVGATLFYQRDGRMY